MRPSWLHAIHRELLRLQRDGWSGFSLITRHTHIMLVGYEDAIRAMWGIQKAPAMAVHA